MNKIMTCCALLACAVCTHAYELVATVSIEGDTRWHFDIELANNDIDFTAFQMDIGLEGEANLGKNDLVCGELTEDHRLMISKQQGHYRVMAINSGLKNFKAKEGQLFSFTIDGDIVGISFNKINFIKPNGTKVEAEVFSLSLQSNNSNAIKDTSEEQDINKVVYNMGDKEIYKIDRRGIYIQNGKKLTKQAQ